MADLITPRVLPAIKGRLSFHQFDAAKAHEEALDGPYKDSAKVKGESKPYANVLITESQYDLIMEFLEQSFVPFSVAQPKGQPHHLTQKEANAILEEIRDGETAPYNVPFKLPTEKTLDLWPEAHRSIRLTGRYGVDLKTQAMIRKPEDLVEPDPERTKYPDRIPLNLTNFEMYKGCWVLAQIEFYTYRINQTPGLSANTDIVIFANDDTMFGGGAELDDDALFAALDA